MNKLVRAGIGFGSNLGDREENIRNAILILENAGLVGIRLSSFIETKPVGFDSTNMFANCVGIVETELNPHEVLNILLQTEKKLGRNRSEISGYADRIIDLDLLFYGDWICADDMLVLPHPRLHERAFVLVPLAEVDTEWVHPVYNKNASQLFTGC